jgi:hypothetical protein
MENAEPERHRLEGSAGHRAHEHCVGQPPAEAGNVEPGRSLRLDPTSLQACRNRPHALLSERFCQRAGVPVDAVGNERDNRNSRSRLAGERVT